MTEEDAGRLRGDAPLKIGLTEPSARARLHLVKVVFIVRLKIMSRYRFFILFDTVLPIIIAALPIMLGTTFAGSAAAAEENFTKNAGTANYRLYLLVGAATFSVTSLSLWLVGFWLRREMETGTLESLYLAPADRVWVLAGLSLYTAVRGLISFTLCILAGSVVLGATLEAHDLAAALVFILLGLVPIWGLSFLFGALILRIKEASSLINLLQWIMGFFMGLFYPITLLPAALRAAAMAFPPSWTVQDVRASLLGISYFLGEWYLDLAVVAAFCFLTPLLGLLVFRRTERSMKVREGVGNY